MNISEELAEIQQELVSMKTQQGAGADSALLYKQTYNPGLYIADTSVPKIHTIKCITGKPLENVIFMPIIQEGISVQYISTAPVPATDFSDTIIWVQHPVQPQITGDTRLFGPQSITIYSNVEFEITATTS